jgi:hypothetical protein
MKNGFYILLLTCTITAFFSCKDKDPVLENPEELITTLVLTFNPHGGGTPVLFQFQDLDGPGGNPPQITAGALTAQTMYHAAVYALNASVSPAIDVTAEILDEAEDHQFFFIVSGVQITHTYDDQDINGNPIGIINTFVTGDPANGTLAVVLRHEPDKFAAGVKDGNIANAGGETDIEVVFPLVIQ